MKTNSFQKILLLLSCFCMHALSGMGQQRKAETPYVVILGTVQDAGSPHINCTKNCCTILRSFPDATRKVVSLGIVDPVEHKCWLLEATPDITSQLAVMNEMAMFTESDIPDGIFLTHAHIGHYSGLVYMGREAINANHVPVYTMPRMKTYLESNGPWSQLVAIGNIKLMELNQGVPVQLSERIKVTPFLVPHRDEFSETVGFIIEGPEKKMLFIPDIDKWEKWGKDILKEVMTVDHALLDATFYRGEELGNRDMSEVPHPTVEETMKLFENQPEEQKSKLFFIHMNHTNPMLDKNSEESDVVTGKGFNIARYRQVFGL